jgi:hypothetical protein
VAGAGYIRNSSFASARRIGAGRGAFVAMSSSAKIASFGAGGRPWRRRMPASRTKHRRRRPRAGFGRHARASAFRDLLALPPARGTARCARPAYFDRAGRDSADVSRAGRDLALHTGGEIEADGLRIRRQGIKTPGDAARRRTAARRRHRRAGCFASARRGRNRGLFPRARRDEKRHYAALLPRCSRPTRGFPR